MFCVRTPFRVPDLLVYVSATAEVPSLSTSAGDRDKSDIFCSITTDDSGWAWFAVGVFAVGAAVFVGNHILRRS